MAEMKFTKTSDGNYELDVCGYVCPHPQLYCKKSLEKMSSGETMKMIFDNPSSAETIIQMVEQAGHELLEQTKDGSKIIFVIEKG
jgi:tRNA 2-thiouridine synthesizing protein A